MKRLIKASTLWDQGWSKRFNRDSGQTYFVFTCPKATACVTKGLDIDNEGKYSSQAEVHFLQAELLRLNSIDDLYFKKTFFGKDSEFDAMAWAEDVIFE